MPHKPRIKPVTHTYTLYLLNKHLFIDLPEGRTLIDTGAPLSASITGRLSFNGQNLGVKKGGYMGFNFDQLSANIGVQVDALLGMDHLALTTLLFDVHLRTLTVGDEMPAGFTTQPYGVVPMSDLPVFPARIHGHKTQVLFDTGAQFGYLTNPKFIQSSTTQPGFEDFSPLFGDLNVAVSYQLPLTIAGHSLFERFGLAPDHHCGGVSPLPMGPSLRMMGIEAIVGPSWMPRLKVWLNPLNRTFALGV